MIGDSPNKNDPSNSTLEKSSKVCLELHSLKLAAQPEINGWKMKVRFGAKRPIFMGKLLVLGMDACSPKWITSFWRSGFNRGNPSKYRFALFDSPEKWVNS